MIIYIQTRYSHWSPHSGYHQFIRHLDPGLQHVHYHSAYSYWSGPGFCSRLGRRVQRRFVTGWTTQRDLLTEIRLLPLVRRLLKSERQVILHFLDGERGCCLFFSLFKRYRQSGRLKLFLTFHQPPAILEQIIHHPHRLAAVDGIMVVGSSQLPFFSFLPAGKVHLVPHGVDTDFFQPPPTPRSWPLQPPLQLLTVGNYLRDFDTLARIIAACPAEKYHFHLVGAGDTGHNFNDCDQVTIHQGIPEQELLALYQGCDLGLMPLRDSTANNVLLEMMACGLPVLCSRVGSITDYCTAECGTLVDNGSVSAFLAAMDQFARLDEQRLRSYRKAARSQALTFAWPRIASQMGRLYSR